MQTRLGLEYITLYYIIPPMQGRQRAANQTAKAARLCTDARAFHSVQRLSLLFIYIYIPLTKIIVKEY